MLVQVHSSSCQDVVSTASESNEDRAFCSACGTGHECRNNGSKVHGDMGPGERVMHGTPRTEHMGRAMPTGQAFVQPWDGASLQRYDWTSGQLNDQVDQVDPLRWWRVMDTQY